MARPRRHRLRARLRGGDQAGDVDGDALVGERLHLLAERVHRGLADDLERDALAHVGLAAPVEGERLGGVRQHVDEAGRDRQAVRLDDGLAEAKGPTSAMVSPSMATSPTKGAAPVPS